MNTPPLLSYRPEHFASYQDPLVAGPGHQHNDVELSIIEGSPATFSVGGRQTTLMPGRLYVFWAMTPHRLIKVDDETHPAIGNAVHVPLSWVLQWQLPSRFVNALLHGQHLAEPVSPGNSGEENLRDLQSLQSWHKQIGGDDPQRLRVVLLEIQARLLSMALDLEASGELDEPVAAQKIPPQQGELSKIETMLLHIALHYNEDLPIEAIAQAANLNEKYAMRLFRATCGTTILQYLTQHRIWHAKRLLASTDLQMVEIAKAVGFGSDSQFFTTFRRMSNISPREYRESIRGKRYRV